MPTTPAPANAYDLVPYTMHPYVHTHPDRIWMVARLLGMDAPDVTKSRILEIGCAAGANIIPMADSLPTSNFVGIDLSKKQIEVAQSLSTSLGLKNLDLSAMDLLDIDDDFGQFDYIIAHGVWSWVGQPAREKLIQICSSNLAPRGVAYISYNTLPGWHLRGAVREMMLYHTRNITDPSEKASAARNLVTFLAGAVPRDRAGYASLLNEEAAQLKGSADGYLLHDHLEADNHACYFWQFAQSAQQQGLQYLGDSILSSMLPSRYPADIQSKLRQLAPDPIALEQYLDFLINRTFRRSLWCKSTVKFDRDISPIRLAGSYVGSAMKSEAPVDVRYAGTVVFRGKDLAIQASSPLTKAALDEMQKAWPLRMKSEELQSRSVQRLRDAALTAAADEASTDPLRLLTTLTQAYVDGLLDASPRGPDFISTITPRPKARRLARVQAQQGFEDVTNLLHATVTVGPIGAQLLQWLDGMTDRDTLIIRLASLLKSKGFTSGQEPARPEVEKSLDGFLKDIARQALLVA